MTEPSLRIVQLTPPGRGAVATLLVEGPAAVDVIDSLFRPRSGRPLTSHSIGRPVFGRIGGQSHFPCGKTGTVPELTSVPGEEVIVRRCREHSVELHCHGGHAAVARIETALVERGGRGIAWRDWAVDHHDDPIMAAAHVALAEARTRRTAAILLDQYHGALRHAMEEIQAAIENNDTAIAGRQIDTLLARAELGQHLIRPWQVVLAGRRNVGKSSLINALLGYPRAIVHHTPGTTRDVVSASTAVDGWPVELSDTAGLHESGDRLEQAGVERAQAKLVRADLVVLVFDVSLPWCGLDRALVETWPSALVVHNKSDLRPAAGPRPNGLATSALRRQGIEALARAIADRLVPEPPLPGAAVPFTDEQVVQLRGLLDR